MINLMEYGFVPTIETMNNKEYIPARISAVHKGLFEIICEHGKVNAKLKSSVYYNTNTEEYPTTGDFVLIQYNESGDSLITKTLPRKSYFSRRDPDPNKGEQAVAANFDYVFIMTSINHDLNLKRLERYLTQAYQSEAIPVIILTKADLCENLEEVVKQVEQIAKGVGVYPISTKTNYGLEELKDYLKPRKTIVFMGSSGVGKSSLVNYLAQDDVMTVNGIREDDSKGRHTTTHRQLLKLNNGVIIIDTPGMRELGMWDVTEGLGETFSDIEELAKECKFSDCKHEKEPGCKVKESINNGELASNRLENYHKLKKEAKYSENKTSYLKDKNEFFKNVSKYQKSNKKNKR